MVSDAIPHLLSRSVPQGLARSTGNHHGSFKQKAFNRGELLSKTVKEWKSQMEMEMDRQKRKAVTTNRGDEITGGKR